MHNEAAKAMRVHGSKLFIDAPQSTSQDDENDGELEVGDDDFFDQHQSNSAEASAVQPLPMSVKLAVRILC